MLTRDQLIKEYDARRGTLPAMLGVYGILVAVLGLTASAII